VSSLLSRVDAAAHELVGHVYALLRLATLLEAVERRGDQVVLTMSVRAYSDLVEAVNAARGEGTATMPEPLEVPK
jgi:hypothetical protein